MSHNTRVALLSALSRSATLIQEHRVKPAWLPLSYFSPSNVPILQVIPIPNLLSPPTQRQSHFYLIGYLPEIEHAPPRAAKHGLRIIMTL